jgi:hypothetical protein
VGHEEHVRDKRNAYRVLVEKSEGKRTLARPKQRRKKNIKIHLQETRQTT